MESYLATPILAKLGGGELFISIEKVRITKGVGLSETTKRLKASEVAVLDPNGPVGGMITGGFGSLSLIDNPPHPNAAKVFLNWILTKDGQQSIVTQIGQNSRRLDTQGPADTALRPGVKYQNVQKQEFSDTFDRATALAKELLR